MTTIKPRSRLGKMVRLYCDAHNVSEREVAKEIGIDKATFNRILHGHEINLGHFVPLLQWLLAFG